MLSEMDGLIEREKPWELVKNDTKKAGEVLGSLWEALRQAAWMLIPFMPETSDKVFEQLGVDVVKEKEKSFGDGRKWSEDLSGVKVEKGESLFPRLEN